MPEFDSGAFKPRYPLTPRADRNTQIKYLTAY